MATGLTHGVRRGSWSVLGLQIGLLAQLVLVAVGLGAVVAKSMLAFHIVKWIGVAYLIYLAVSNGAAPRRTCAPGWAGPASGAGCRWSCADSW